MNLIIHRGADQIGGCITEISIENCKILIDFGSTLPGCKKEELTEEQVKSIIGHADVETLKEVCQTVHPRIGVIPIHKDENSRYDSISGISSYFIFDEGDVDIHGIHISVK